MVLFMLTILHARVVILSYFLDIHIHFKETSIFTDKSLFLVKWYVKEPIFPQYL